jgi:hypothetical protein
LIAALGPGCSTVPKTPYPYGKGIEQPNTLLLRPGEPQFEYGRTNAFIDTVGWILGIPSKIILLDRRVDNHRIRPPTIEALQTYLAQNDLTNVKVRVNQYAPSREWGRLFRNKSVGAGWRYTIGILSMAFYTVLPGRLIGGDSYNPYSNTINLYSDHKAIALHEGGHAKDTAGRKYKGTYSFTYILPFVALYHEAQATSDAVGYMRVERSVEEEKEAFKILYPAYATYIGGSFGTYLMPAEPLVFFAAVIPGHIVGRIKAADVDERRAEESQVPSPMSNVNE